MLRRVGAGREAGCVAIRARKRWAQILMRHGPVCIRGNAGKNPLPSLAGPHMRRGLSRDAAASSAPPPGVSPSKR